MAKHAIEPETTTPVEPIGNYEQVRVAELIEDHLAHGEVTREEFVWWSDVASKMLREAMTDE